MRQETKNRCGWATHELMVHYHDTEWGVPVHDDVKHFEFMVLESAQAGLSWLTVLKKRDNYREAFSGFIPEAVARYTEEDKNELLTNPGIIRNRAKIDAAITNARLFLEIQAEFGSFDAFIWDFVGGKPKVNKWKSLEELPATTPQSDALSKALKKRGFKFVGSTICYGHMQAAGLVNDHLIDCFRYHEI